MKSALLIDFGSTYTKLRAVDMEAAAIIGTGQGPSTVASDITVGLHAALADLEAHMGGLPAFTHRLASSSAAGGLAMVTVGLVPELTAEAARQAALGAGARLVGAFSHELTTGDMAEITGLMPDIILLAGGTDGGNRKVIEANGARLAESTLTCPVIVAGNRQAADGVRRSLGAAGMPVTVTENVMPDFGVLNIEPARAAIRQVFIETIVHAKGIDRAAELFDQVLMPTPAAVMEGARLLAEGAGGPDGPDGLGPLMVIDVGGATTDVHSIGDGAPAAGVVFKGLPEPYAKRTVEGDLGMRLNVRAILETAGAEALAADAGLTTGRVAELIDAIAGDVGRLPGSDDDRALDRALARAAVGIAVRRHAGTTETVYATTGPVTVQRGKNLGDVGVIIGTGGPIAHGSDPAAVLKAALVDPADPFSLRPRAPRLLLDRDYMLFALGLLGAVDPAAALTFGLAHMHPLGEETDHGCGPQA